VTLRRLLLFHACLGVLVFSAPKAQAGERSGQGRVQFAAGIRWIPNAGFVNEARAKGYDVGSRSYGLAPVGLLTFGYWVEEHLELSLEGSASYDSYGSAFRIQSATLGGTLRYSPWQTQQLWPYVGANFGYSLNGVKASLPSPLDSFAAEGYGGALMIGTGVDLSTHFGVSFEVRYYFASIAIPPFFSNNLNAGGISFLIGAYLRLPKPHETMEPQLPKNLDEELAPTP
jgi:hypothetical protein